MLDGQSPTEAKPLKLVDLPALEPNDSQIPAQVSLRRSTGGRHKIVALSLPKKIILQKTF